MTPIDPVEDAAEHTDLFIYPITDAAPAGTDMLHRTVMPYAYISNLYPCQICAKQISMPGMRQVGWEHYCPFCKNYIYFDQVYGLYNLFTRYGKKIQDWYKFADMHYRHKSTPWYNQGLQGDTEEKPSEEGSSE